MPLLKPLTLFLLALFLSLDGKSEVRRFCTVKYQTESGWSKEYTTEVTFITGRELNKASHSNNYNNYSYYCLVWFDKGAVAVLEIKDYLLSIGEEFNSEDFRTAFYLEKAMECEQFNSKSKRLWKIEAKKSSRFIDPREIE
jgi:hypothetical protein